MGSILVLGPMIISSILNQQASLAVNNISTLIDRSTNFNHVYVKTEPVDDGTKCYVSKNSANIVQENRFKILHNKNADEKVRKYVARSFVKYVLTLC